MTPPRPFASPLAKGIALPLAIAVLKARTRAEMDADRWERAQRISRQVLAQCDPWRYRHSSREGQQS